MPKIKTTHTGSLPRPPDLEALLDEHERGGEAVALADRAQAAVAEVVRAQLEIGLDVVNDGEQTKSGYSTYVKDRLTGFEGPPGPPTPRPENDAYPGFPEISARLMPRTLAPQPTCNGPIALKDKDAVGRDIEALRAAAQASGIGTDRLFMSAASPGVIAHFFTNNYYPDRAGYLEAIVEAMRDEYRAIVDAGVLLQLDCPDFAMSRNSVFFGMDREEFRRVVAQAVEALNAAVADLPPDRMRLHVCWGNYEGPHTSDVPLADIIDLLVRARPTGISVEACNPRHGHEWEVFESFELPSDRYLMPGVVDTTTNFVEHPELVAHRLRQYVRLLGAERVVAGTDCGFATFVGRSRVAGSVAWAKLRSMVEGARLASAS
jgi:5-methyltetrahydropteroyltriglutamate--homocysteine methyltransferase